MKPPDGSDIKFDLNQQCAENAAVLYTPTMGSSTRTKNATELVLERVGDSIENVAELIEELFEHELHLSEGGMNDYKEISNEVGKFIDFTIDSMRKDDVKLMNKALALEDNINRMREEMRGNYLVRLHSGVCAVDPGLMLVDMLTAFEKICDYCYNIAQAVAGVK